MQVQKYGLRLFLQRDWALEELSCKSVPSNFVVKVLLPAITCEVHYKGANDFDVQVGTL